MKQDKRWRNYKIFLYTVLFSGIIMIGVLSIADIYKKVPNTIKIRAGKEESIDFGVPVSGELYKEAVAVGEFDSPAVPVSSIHLDLNKPVTFKAYTTQNYVVDTKLFGIFPLKNVKLEVIQDTMLIPAGIPVGIYVKTEGVLVIGTGSFLGMDGIQKEPALHLLKIGDYIEQINGVPVRTKKEFIEAVQTNESEDMILHVKRDDSEISLKVKAELSDAGDYKLGIWIRDSAQGIGTLTFVDEEGNFGALGHGINDADTSALMDLELGSLYQTDIIAIKRGGRGTPGELTGVIDYAKENIVGDITANTAEGIFGVCNETLLNSIHNTPFPIGLKQEVRLGSGQILCCVNGGQEPEYYDVEIIEINPDNSNHKKGLVIQITDPELLSLTGGIVQGMSGSPIIQDGKIIGAVTHVLVQDSTKGYGIFIEKMLVQ